MRSYSCEIYYENKEGNLEQIPNTACFAGVEAFSIDKTTIGLCQTTIDVITKKENESSLIYVMFFKTAEYINRNTYTIIEIAEIANNDRTIYISDFRQPETEEYIDYLLKIINEITPCEIVTINNIEYIKVNLLNTYDQSLIILNFIRNLWNNPVASYREQLNENSYYYKFFNTLKSEDCNSLEDPLSKLLYANKIACENFGGSTGHSNTANPDLLLIKTKKQLLNYKGNSTHQFLTDKKTRWG